MKKKEVLITLALAIILNLGTLFYSKGTITCSRVYAERGFPTSYLTITNLISNHPAEFRCEPYYGEVEAFGGINQILTAPNSPRLNFSLNQNLYLEIYLINFIINQLLWMLLVSASFVAYRKVEKSQ